MSELSNQRDLTLLRCPGLTDVNSFHKVIITELLSKYLRYYSSGGICDLLLHGCANIKDISCFGNHRRLSLSAISSGFDVLLHIPHVYHLVRLKMSVTDSQENGQGVLLQHLLSLTLDSLKVVKLEGLGHIPTVRLVGCNALQTMKGLGSNRCVEVDVCSVLNP